MSTKELPFSIYTRYQALADSINQLRQKNQKFKILEVGGRGNFLQQFVPLDTVKILDVIDSKEENYIKGDGRSLPFANKHFDLVVSTDVLEHIPKIDRDKFINEKIRVASTAVILCAPVYSKIVSDKEKEANDYFKSFVGAEHPWLIEHIEYGLPDKETIEKIFINKNLKWSVWCNQRIDLWFELLIGELSLSAIEAEKIPEFSKKINKIYNNFIYPFDKIESDGYRWIYTVMTNDKMPPKIPNFKINEKFLANYLIKLLSELSLIERKIVIKSYQNLNNLAQQGQKKEQELAVHYKNLEKDYQNILEINQQLNARIKRFHSTLPYKIYNFGKKILKRQK